MSAARAFMAEALDVALQDAGLASSAEAVDKLVEAVADSLEVMAGESLIGQQAWGIRLAVASVSDPDKTYGPYWSSKTLQGLALMLRRRS